MHVAAFIGASLIIQGPAGSTFDFAGACRAFNENQIRFRQSYLGRSARFEAVVSTVQDDGKTTWVMFFPRSAGSRSDVNTSFELMGSLFYGVVPPQLRSRISAWNPGDVVSLRGDLASLRATFRDRITISGSTINGYGYMSGGTITVKTLIWTFSLRDARLLRTSVSIKKEEAALNALAHELRQRQAQRNRAELALRQAVTSGDVEEARLLISQGVRYDFIRGKSLLLEAVSARAYRTTRLLLHLPLTKVNYRDADGYTALRIALRENDLSLIALLKEHGGTE